MGTIVEIIHRVARRLRGRVRTAGYRLRAAARRRSVSCDRRFLLIAAYDSHWLGNMRDSVHAVLRCSRHRLDVVNLVGLTLWGGLRIPNYVRFADYDGVLLHHSLPYRPELLAAMELGRRETLAGYGGLKVLMKQDEHYGAALLTRYLRENGFHLMLTCVPPADIERVYPRSEVPSLRFLHVRTGYVTPQMRACRASSSGGRPVDIGYRGSSMPFAFGRLCYEKKAIGELFAGICAERKWVADISSRPEDRFFGGAWYRFLSRCKATLGVESGGSIFDFTGALQRQCEDYLRRHPQADFKTVHRLLLAPHEGNVRYNQISPRHLEAAACRTLQILYEGEYSGVFRPGRHYLSLRRDLGNLEEVLNRFSDPAERARITEQAFEEIILNDAYQEARFVEELDDAIDATLASGATQLARA